MTEVAAIEVVFEVVALTEVLKPLTVAAEVFEVVVLEVLKPAAEVLEVLKRLWSPLPLFRSTEVLKLPLPPPTEIVTLQIFLLFLFLLLCLHFFELIFVFLQSIFGAGILCRLGDRWGSLLQEVLCRLLSHC